MKNWEKIIFSYTGIVISMICFLIVTVGWFTMSQNVKASNLQISMDAPANLIISKTEEGIKASGVATSGSSIEYDSSAGRSLMLPATADWNVGTDTGLKYPKNTWNIDFYSGLLKEDLGEEEALYGFNAVEKDADSLYYVDYEAYIASSGKPMSDVKLSANISCDSDIETHKATTVAFYQGHEVLETNYVGSINVKNQASGVVNFTLRDNLIPCNTGDEAGYIHIIARCYFDGALLDDDNTAIIKSSTINTAGVILKISFYAEDSGGE